MTDIHVVFGAGPIGRAAVDALLAQGLPVRVVSRSEAVGLPPDVAPVRGDASDAAFAQEAAAGAAAVYQCMNPPYARWGDLFPPLQRAVIAAAQAANARYVSMENVYAYGDTHGAPITEALPNAPHTRKGKVRAAMADELARLSAAGDLAAATARASDYFGPYATSQSPLGERVIEAALAGKAAQVVGDPDQPHSYTYAADVGRVLATLGTDDRALGQIWHVPNAPARTTRDLIGMIAEAIGHDVKVSAAPRWLLRLLGLFNADVRELDEMLYEFTQPFIVDGSKFEDAFGIGATPFEESLPATVEWWRGRG
jgi:nucleoside-diphosphate-sugar epimerase